MAKKKKGVNLRAKVKDLDEFFDVQLGLLRSQVSELIVSLRECKQYALSGDHMRENADYYNEKLQDIVGRATVARAAWMALTELAEVRDDKR